MYERRGGAVEPPHIGGGRKGVDVSFVSFLCAKEKRRKSFVFLRQRKRGEKSFFSKKREVCFFAKEKRKMAVSKLPFEY